MEQMRFVTDKYGQWLYSIYAVIFFYNCTTPFINYNFAGSIKPHLFRVY